MDLRMYGQHFEEMYLQAQEEYKVSFIRGRVSEIAETEGSRLQLKAEDTLSGRPVKMVFDLVVLLVGIMPPASSVLLGKSMGLPHTDAGFHEPLSHYINANETVLPGVFLAGSCREPLSVQETVTDARAASLKILDWLKLKEKR
jgi:heterodisulfide reductase subunit A